MREIQLTDWSTAGNLSNRSSGVQIPRDICTRFGRYLYSTRCSWIIRTVTTVMNEDAKELTSKLAIDRVFLRSTAGIHAHPLTILVSSAPNLKIFFFA